MIEITLLKLSRAKVSELRHIAEYLTSTSGKEHKVSLVVGEIHAPSMVLTLSDIPYSSVQREVGNLLASIAEAEAVKIFKEQGLMKEMSDDRH